MRSVNIDMKSIAFSTPEMIEKFSRIRLLNTSKKKRTILKPLTKNTILTLPRSEICGARQILVFSGSICWEYLKHYLDVNQDDYPGASVSAHRKGAPDANSTASCKAGMVEDEMVQSEIFGTIFTVIPELGLKSSKPQRRRFQKCFWESGGKRSRRCITGKGLAAF
ncbi:MAG: hypothetical protein U5L09_20520 [Bacteroidales bacterium]|nr:hypothetical protein [Bacteroidales bacterium]